jgi:hypothetical protein
VQSRYEYEAVAVAKPSNQFGGQRPKTQDPGGTAGFAPKCLRSTDSRQRPLDLAESSLQPPACVRNPVARVLPHKTANEYLGLIERAENGPPRACANWTGPSSGQ